MFDYDATKKRVISARGSTHKQWNLEDEEGAIERVTAFALSDGGRDRLGNLLWRLKYGQEKGWRDLVSPAQHFLVRMFKPRKSGLRPRFLEGLAAIAMTEWLGDQCPKCGGRGSLGAGREIVLEKRVACTPCGGEGFTEQDWPSVTLARLTGAIMGNEVVVPASLRRINCAGCRGKGFRFESSKHYSRVRSCVPCQGTGRRRMSKQHRIAELGIPAKLYDKWRRTYLRMLRELRATDAELAMRIDFRLDRGENPDDSDSPPAQKEELYDLPGTDEPDEPLKQRRGHPRG